LRSIISLLIPIFLIFSPKVKYSTSPHNQADWNLEINGNLIEEGEGVIYGFIGIVYNYMWTWPWGLFINNFFINGFGCLIKHTPKK
jgi:hypothetical protein